MSKIHAVIVDEGASQAKTVFRRSTDKLKELIKQITPSTVEKRLKNDGMFYHKDSFITDAGYPLTVTENNYKPQTNSKPERYQVSDANLATVQKALMDAGFGGMDVVIGVTLPIGLFYKPDGEHAYNKRLVDAKKANLMRKITAKGKDRVPANIVGVAVFPEAESAFDELVYDAKGAPKYSGTNNRYATIDIGDATTDIAIFYSDGTLDDKMSFPCGVYHVRQELKPLIDGKYGINSGYDVLRDVLKGKRFNGEDATEQTTLATKLVFNEAIDDIDAFLGSANSFDKIFIIGGGAHVFGDEYRAEFGDNIEIPEDPEFTLATSMLGELEYLIENGVFAHLNEEAANVE